MKKFQVPVTITECGWVTVEAKNEDEAIEKAEEHMSSDGTYDRDDANDFYQWEIDFDGTKGVREL